MDTLPYWYTKALKAFADVSEAEFLDAAEHWIVDRWGVEDNPRRWSNEPRKDRFSDRSARHILGHRHGARPVVEIFHTYLEWHAMWCTIGELMQTRALTTLSDNYNDYYALENQLSAENLTMPPFWLADLRRMKPLEAQLWFEPPGEIDTWVEAVKDDDFFAELGLANENGMLVIASAVDTRSSKFTLSAGVQTALVSPDTASALVRAFQTANSSWDYRMPTARDDLQIDDPPYKLIGWLIDMVHDEGIDERDPFRYGIRAIERRPSNETLKALNLEFVHDDQVRWVDARSRKTIFVYEAWGDIRGDVLEDDLRYSQMIHSSGWRLYVDRDALRTMLHQAGLDLIVNVEIKRRNNGYDYSSSDEEKVKEGEFARVLILRQDESLEAAEGRLGTWTASDR